MFRVLVAPQQRNRDGLDALVQEFGDHPFRLGARQRNQHAAPVVDPLGGFRDEVAGDDLRRLFRCAQVPPIGQSQSGHPATGPHDEDFIREAARGDEAGLGSHPGEDDVGRLSGPVRKLFRVREELFRGESGLLGNQLEPFDQALDEIPGGGAGLGRVNGAGVNVYGRYVGERATDVQANDICHRKSFRGTRQSIAR